MADKEPTGIKSTLPKGFECTINGLEVVLNENLHFTIKNAYHPDQAASFSLIHGLPGNFDHHDEEKNVNVTYSERDAARIETSPEEAAMAKKLQAEADKQAKAEQDAAAKTTAAEKAAADKVAAAAKAEAAKAAADKKAADEAAAKEAAKGK